MLKFTSRAIQPPDPQSFRFPRTARLHASGDFANVRERGQTSQGRFLRVTVLRIPGGDELRLGVVTSRRVGPAVDRSRMRRRIRELFRTGRPDLAPGFWIVVVAKSGSGGAAFSVIRDEWLRLLKRLSMVRSSA